jgi:hypothetical protein
VSEYSPTQQRAVLVILLAACERALEAFQIAENLTDKSFVRDLERVIERTRGEIAAITELMEADSS